MMKRVTSAVFASLLLATSAAWAGGGHGNGHGQDKHHDKWEQKQWKKDRKAWEKQQKHAAKHGHSFHQSQVVTHHYYTPAPVVEQRYYIERQPVFVSAPGVYIGISN